MLEIETEYTLILRVGLVHGGGELGFWFICFCYLVGIVLVQKRKRLDFDWNRFFVCCTF